MAIGFSIPDLTDLLNDLNMELQGKDKCDQHNQFSEYI